MLKFNYGYINSQWNVNGESAMSGNGAFATLNSASFQASKQVAITAIQRYYSAKYWGS